MKTCRCGGKYQKTTSGSMVAEASIVEIDGIIRIHASSDNYAIDFYCPHCTRPATAQEIEFFNKLLGPTN